MFESANSDVSERDLMDQNTSQPDNALSSATLERMKNLRRNLLHLHKTLLDMERADYEQQFGPVNSGELLQLVLNHAQFAWLRRISALMVEIDEMLDADEAATAADVQNLFVQARALFISPADESFKEKYQAALQREPEVVVSHANVAKLLRKESN
jgi:hypothetical protein